MQLFKCMLLICFLSSDYSKIGNECWLQVIELPIKHPELFESLGVAQPKVSHPCYNAATLNSCQTQVVAVAPNLCV